MFHQLKGVVCPAYRNMPKRLISSEITQVLNTRLDPLAGGSANKLQLAVVSKNLNALNLDLLVNNLNLYEDRLPVLDLLANLRSTKLANTCLESTHFAVVRYLLENASAHELVSVLLDRPQYGIFLNDFTGFAVCQTFHDEKEYILALELVLKLVLLDKLDSAFVHAFCLKSSMETLKKDVSKDQTSDDKALSPPKGKIQEQKIRVKYIRNKEEVNQDAEIGKAILKVALKILEGNTKDNAKILGLVLTKNYVELDKILGNDSIEIMADTANICKQLLSRENQVDLVNKIEKLQSTALFEDFINGILNETAAKEATTLAETQKQLLPKWQKLRAERKLAMDNEITKQQRIEKIGKLKDEIETKKELLWFFDHEDKLDLEIYNKVVFYPKRWFGKKKKPRVVDEHYVPPQIRRIK